MAQPDPYERQANFVIEQTNNPNTPMSGALLDAEFDAIKATLTTILNNLAILQRDDTKIANGSVHPDALSQDSLQVLNGILVPRGDWLSNTAYNVNDVVNYTPTGTVYVCLEANSDAVFTASKWMQFSAFNPNNSVFTGVTEFDGVQANVVNKGTVAAAGDTTLDFGAGMIQTVNFSGVPANIFTSNRAAGRPMDVRIVNTSGAILNLSSLFSNFTWINSKPVDLAIGKTALMSLRCFGAAEADILAAWSVEL